MLDDPHWPASTIVLDLRAHGSLEGEKSLFSADPHKHPQKGAAWPLAFFVSEPLQEKMLVRVHRSKYIQTVFYLSSWITIFNSYIISKVLKVISALKPL